MLIVLQVPNCPTLTAILIATLRVAPKAIDLSRSAGIISKGVAFSLPPKQPKGLNLCKNDPKFPIA